MTKPADVSPGSRIRTICLPPFDPPVTTLNTDKTTTFFMRPNVDKTQSNKKKTKPRKPTAEIALKYLEKLNNLTKSVFNGFNKMNKNMRYNVRVSNDSVKNEVKITDELAKSEDDNKTKDLVYDSVSLDSVVKLIRRKNNRNKNRHSVVNSERSDKKLLFGEEIDPFIEETNGLDFKDECYATGWGREQTNGNLTDVLLEAKVPIFPLQICRDRYSLTLPLNEGHLCAGSTDGSTGACVVRFY